MKMGQEWEAWAETIPCGARVHLRGKTAAHYQEGVRKLFSWSKLSKLAFPPASSSSALPASYVSCLPAGMLLRVVKYNRDS